MDMFANMTQRDRILLAVLGCMLLVFGSYFIVIKPKAGELISLRDEYDKEVQAYGTDANKLRRLQELERRFELTEIELIKVKKALPERLELASLIVEISNIFEDSGIEVVGIAPEPVVEENNFGVQNIEVSIKHPSSMYRLLSAMRRIENSSRYMKVLGIDAKSEEGKKKKDKNEEQIEYQASDAAPERVINTKIKIKLFATDEEVPKEPGKK